MSTTRNDDVFVPLPAAERRSPWAARLGRVPVWVVSGQVAIFVMMVFGFHAVSFTRIKATILLMLMSTFVMIGLGPSGNSRRIYISLPLLAFLSWYLLSYSWTFNEYAWKSEAQQQVSMILCLVAVMSLLPVKAIGSALVTSCYAVIAYTVLYTAASPAAATGALGVPGWRGGFVHKNGMAPYMVIAVMILCTFDTRRLPRNLAVATAAFLIIMSRSTTTLAMAAVLIPLWFLLGKLSRSSARRKGPIMLSAITAALVGGLVAASTLPLLLRARGKDLTLSGRTQIWGEVWRLVQKRPLLGYGIGGVWKNPAEEPTRSIIYRLGFTVFHSHSGYLEMLVLLGWVGMLLWTWLTLLYFNVSINLLKWSQERIGRLFALTGVLLLIGSFSEVFTLDIWLSLQCGFLILALRIRAEAREAAQPSSGRFRRRSPSPLVDGDG